ncbi:MAG: hypothetical protein ACLSFT_02160 [Ruminococcus callidus]
MSAFEEYDHGFDFYAPQTYTDRQGRRILIGWLGCRTATTAIRNGNSAGPIC